MGNKSFHSLSQLSGYLLFEEDAYGLGELREFNLCFSRKASSYIQCGNSQAKEYENHDCTGYEKQDTMQIYKTKETNKKPTVL